MKIDQKYKLLEFPFSLRVIEAYDFRDEPILLLEKDQIGNTYLSYLVTSNYSNEQRIYLQVSKERLSAILENEISIHEAFSLAENNHIYLAEFSLQTGEPLDFYIIPSKVFADINPISKEYLIEVDYSHTEVILDDSELISYSVRKQKLILDFYLQSKNLINNIKPYAIYKVLTPIVEIIKSMLDFDSRNADKFLAFSNLRQNSLGVTIEINYSQDFFLEKESAVLETLIELLNAQEKDDFTKIISKTKNEKYIKEYTTIIKTIIDNNANLHTAYANPITKKIMTSNLDKARAEKAKITIDETLEIIEDVEEIIGTFLEIDIDSKEPTFKIHSNEENFTVKGKFELSLLEKVKNDFVNIGKESYKFSIKTIYHPETTLKSEEIKRFMIGYEKK